jgi:hypothetical protein
MQTIKKLLQSVTMARRKMCAQFLQKKRVFKFIAIIFMAKIMFATIKYSKSASMVAD